MNYKNKINFGNRNKNNLLWKINVENDKHNNFNYKDKKIFSTKKKTKKNYLNKKSNEVNIITK